MSRPMTAREYKRAMKKWKVPVVWYPGWASRGRPSYLGWSDIKGIIIHHTGSDSQARSYIDWLFTEGRASEGIPAPLAQVMTSMAGKVWVGALGRANHAGKGSTSTYNKVVSENYDGYDKEIAPGPDGMDGNARYYGNEVMFDGGQSMTDPQYRAVVLWCAAICDHYGWTALSIIGHREWSARKWDPGHTQMWKLRRDVQALLDAGPGGDIDNKEGILAGWTEKKLTSTVRSAIFGYDGVQIPARFKDNPNQKWTFLHAIERMWQWLDWTQRDVYWSKTWAREARDKSRENAAHLDKLDQAVVILAESLPQDVHTAVKNALTDNVVSVDVTVKGEVE